MTLNTDNRLMCRTTMTHEMYLAHTTFGCDLADLERVTTCAMNAAFYPYAERHRLLDEVILPGYRQAAERLGQA